MAPRDEKTYAYERLARGRRWDDFASRYEITRRLRLAFETLIRPEELRGRRVLDAGSGGGHFASEASRLGARVCALDVGTGLLRQVAARCDAELVVGSVLQLPFRCGSFDLVLCTEVIEHTPAPLAAIAELKRVVRPGGILALTVPCRLWRPAVLLATKLRLRPYEGHENFLWPAALRRAVAADGFAVEHFAGFNFVPFFWRRLDRAFRLLDRLYGAGLPCAMVNLAVRPRRVP